MRRLLAVILTLAGLLVGLPCAAVPPDGIWSIIPAFPRPSSDQPDMMYDAARHRMLLFGGATFGRPRAVIWARPTDGSSRWDPLPSNGAPSSVGLYPNAILDTARDRIVIWDGWNQMLWSVSLGPVLQWSGRVIPGSPNLENSAVAFDAVHRRMLLWSGGGNGQPRTSDVWALPLDDDLAGWTALPALGPAPTPRDGAVAVVDVAHDRLVIHGGRDFTHSVSHLVRGDVWALPLSGPMQWMPLFTADVSNDLLYSGHAAVVDTLRQRMLLFGGATGDYTFSTHAEVKAFALDGTNAWSVAVAPDAERLGVGGGVAAAYDGGSDAVLEYQPNWNAGFSSTHRLALSPSPEWSVVEPNPQAPPQRFGQATAFDPVRSRWLSFGGRLSYFSGDIWTLTYDDLWSLRILDRAEWEVLQPTGVAPPARQDGRMLYDPGGDRMVLFGGQVTDGVSRPFPNRPGHGTPHFHGDTWTLSLAGTPSWSPVALGGPSPGPRDGHLMVLDTPRSRVLVFGGRDSLGFKNDLWSLSLEGAPEWTRLDPVSAPPSPRWQAAGCYDPAGQRLVVAGGRDSTGSVGDVFEISLAGAPLEWVPLPAEGAWPTIGAATRSHVFDAARERLLIFGDGSVEESGWPTAPIPAWKLVLGNPPVWSPLESEGDWPGRLYGMGVAIDPVGERVLLAGGTNDPRGTSTRSEQWILTLGDIATPTELALISSEKTSGGIELVWWRPSGAPFIWRVERREEWEGWRDLGTTTAESDDRLRFMDADVLSGKRYAYRLRTTAGGGERLTPEWWVSIPAEPSLKLESLRPNPASLGATVSFELSQPGRVEVAVFDLVGRRREELVLLTAAAGKHSATVGAALEAGVYLVRLRQSDQTRVRRLLVLR